MQMDYLKVMMSTILQLFPDMLYEYFLDRKQSE